MVHGQNVMDAQYIKERQERAYTMIFWWFMAGMALTHVAAFFLGAWLLG